MWVHLDERQVRLALLTHGVMCSCSCSPPSTAARCHMADAYTLFWTRKRCEALRRLGWAVCPLETLFGGPHISEPSFRRAGVRSGDTLYPIAVRAGILSLLGRTRVRRILAYEDFVKERPDLSPPHSQNSWPWATAFARPVWRFSPSPRLVPTRRWSVRTARPCASTYRSRQRCSRGCTSARSAVSVTYPSICATGGWCSR